MFLFLDADVFEIFLNGLVFQQLLNPNESFPILLDAFAKVGMGEDIVIAE